MTASLTHVTFSFEERAGGGGGGGWRRCMIKIFREVMGGDTFKTPLPPLRTTFAFTHHLF